jgi:peptidoglycan biosynthesis protein MviN/MurJ (putative lipid II flippase)
MLRGFYAFEDTKTPAGITLVMNIVTITCASIGYFVLPIRLITVGIAVSFGIGYLASSQWARHLLGKRIGVMHLRRDVITLTFISAIAFLPSVLITLLIKDHFNSGSPNLITSAMTLAMSGVIALPIYFGLGLRLKVAPIEFVSDAIKNRFIKR